MTTTAKDLIIRAVARRTANDPDKTAGRPELIRALSDYLRQIYVQVAEVDIEFFGTSSDVTGASGVWAIPSTMIAVFDVRDSDDEAVSVVPFRDKDADIPPRVYQLGSSLYTVGETDDPGASAVLTLYGAALHAALDPTAVWDDAANTLESSWPERHNDLLVAVLARYLAFKGGRPTDVQEHDGEVTAAKALLFAEAELRAKTRSARW